MSTNLLQISLVLIACGLKPQDLKRTADDKAVNHYQVEND